MIVTGGWTGSADSAAVEFLRVTGPNLLSETWERGPDLPVASRDMYLVSEETSASVLLVGGIKAQPKDEILKTMYRLEWIDDAPGSWERIPVDLKAGRRYFPAFLVPDHLVNCTAPS